jgi:hypothetical protein
LAIPPKCSAHWGPTGGVDLIKLKQKVKTEILSRCDIPSLLINMGGIDLVTYMTLIGYSQ